jgi:hypothetical protein
MAIITKTFSYEGGVRIAEVPAGTTTLTIHIWAGAGGGGGADAGGDGGTGSAGHYVTKTDIDMTSYAGIKNIAVAVGGGGKGGSTGSGAAGGTNGKSLTAYSGGTGGPSGSTGTSGSGGGGGGATIVSIFADGESVDNTVLAIAGGGAGGGGAGRLSTGGTGSNTNNPTAATPGTLGENGAGHDADGGGAGAGGGGADGGTGGSGDQGDIGAFGGRAGSNTVPVSGSSDDGSGVTPGGTASGYYETGIAVGGASQTAGGNGRAVLIFNVPSASNYKVGGAWKKLNSMYHKVSGTWKNITAAYTKVSGQWKAIFATDVIFSINYALFGDATGNPTSGTAGTAGVPAAVGTVDTSGGSDTDLGFGRTVPKKVGRQEWGGIEGVEAVWSGTTQTNPDKGSGSNARVICTYFHSRGMLDLQDLQCDYEWTRQHIGDNVKIGYWLWAMPLVKWMERHENSEKLWHRFAIATTFHFARARAHEISYQMGARSKGSLFGKCVRLVGETLCGIVGFVAKPWIKDKYELLLKDY